jgi:nitrogen fixation protein FixH
MSAGMVGADLIRLAVVDRAGAPIAGLRLTARLERPATEQGRRDIRFVETAPGVYQARPGALAGAWDLRLSAYDRQNHRFDAERRLIAP